ncbi:MAG: DNA polymerase III subunit alpha [Bacteroidota bacterium]
MYLIFDTETTGLPKNYNAPVSDSDNWPRLVQIAWQLHDASGKLINHQNYIVKPVGFDIPFNAEKVHGISTERALIDGHDLSFVLTEFEHALERTDWVIGHNIEFDLNILGAEHYREQVESVMTKKTVVDTKDKATDFCAIPGGKGGRFKWPTLTELHIKLFDKPFDEAHDAAYDVDATAKCFFGLLKERVIPSIDGRKVEDIIYEPPKLAAANFAAARSEGSAAEAAEERLSAGTETASELIEEPFSHLHCHSQFSVLQATTEIESLVGAAKNMGMPAIALTDHGNMMAAFNFVKTALKAEIKPIVGCEFNLCRDHKNKSQKDDGFQVVLLAKNKAGYHNLAKLASIAYIDGFYYLPRIDKEVLVQYKDNLIVLTGGLWGEVPYTILNFGESQAEEAFLWWKEQFGEDFYIELNRHGVEEEEIVNKTLLKFAKKHGVKYLAANNTYYTGKEDSKAHDILLCVKDGETVDKPKKYIGKRGREFRYGFPNDEFYIKSPEEMKALFADLPEAIYTTNEVVEKIEPFTLEREVLLPKFNIPEEFQDARDKDDGGKRGEVNYLRHLTYEGAKQRYKEITPEIKERLDFELEVIEKTGYPGYFLIVQDFTTAARKMDVSVGPGRGSAAGSAVAYCIGITNVDPIEYDLLFERFLNPERVSLPDIDIDFDDEGRQRVIDYVIDKYGANQVAQIITYGTMAAKSSIRDTARALNLPLPDADRLAKLVPDIKLSKLFSLDDKALAEILKNNSDSMAMARELKTISTGDDDLAKTLNQARILEGSVRNTGIHACGVIITPDDITRFVPVALAKDTEMYCTQFDNSVVENAGLLKMDFLGLKTLTLIKHAVKNVKKRHKVDLDPDSFPKDDEETYKLFQRGETVGIFQYESPGMQKYLKELKPTVFADLIAMNALYRPGPLEYIPQFIKRKHGQEAITYDLDDMHEFLEETYGITVYQEQVMLLSQKLAGFTKGEADMLRKAMGKKIFALLEKLKPKFIEQGAEKGYPKDKLGKIWKDWEAFASYAFNKSHSTCYAWVAYQTAYLKAHYPSEYMASVLSNNMNDLKEVTFFMDECRRMGINVLGPDVNESHGGFMVNQNGDIRFGMAAIKGVGAHAVEHIIEEREKNGPYLDIYNFVERVNLNTVNKKNLEGLALAGAFDEFPDIKRHQFFHPNDDGTVFLDTLIRYGNLTKSQTTGTLFDFESTYQDAQTKPEIPECEEWSQLEILKREKELIGIYLSAHPLDTFKFELENLNTTPLSAMKDLAALKDREISITGMVTHASEKIAKNGNPYGSLTIEDYTDSYNLMLFSKEYVKYKNYFGKGYFLLIKGRVQEHPWRKDGSLEFKINFIQMLSELRDEGFKNVLLKVPVQLVSETLIHEIEQFVDKNGKTLLKFMIYDRENSVAVDMFSRTKKVNLSDGFIRYLKMNDEIEYKVS